MLGNILHLLGIKKKPKVGWLLLGDINTGSSRIHGINIHNYLLKNGIDSVILQTSPQMNRNLTLSPDEQEAILSSRVNILIFQKVFDEKAVEFAKAARARGIKTIFLLSDNHETNMICAVDRLVVTSETLKTYLDEKFSTDALVIEDAIEVPSHIFKKHEYIAPVQLVWVGHRDNWQSLGMIRQILTESAVGTFKLKTISNHPDADVPWALNTVFSEILAGDIAVIPAFDSEWGWAKSNNRLSMFMALGMPVVASPIPVYNKILRNGINGFLAETEDDWAWNLAILKDHEVRARIGRQARLDAMAHYNINIIGKQWLDFIKTLHCL